LSEIAQLLPADFSHWKHDELVGALRRKIADIAAMEDRLRRSKVQLQTLIKLVENKPPDIDCADNAKRIFKELQHEVGAPCGRGRRRRSADA
jgi:hypothetical protein